MTGDPGQDSTIISGNRHFGKYRVFFQFRELGIQRTAADKVGVTVFIMKQTQITPHLPFGITMGTQHMLIISHSVDISGDLSLKILLTIRAGDGHQRQIAEGNACQGERITQLRE